MFGRHQSQTERLVRSWSSKWTCQFHLALKHSGTLVLWHPASGIWHIWHTTRTMLSNNISCYRLIKALMFNWVVSYLWKIEVHPPVFFHQFYFNHSHWEFPNTLSAYLFKAIWKVPFCAGVPRATCLDLSKLVRITAADNKKEKSLPFSLGHWIFFRKKLTKKSDCANPCKILNEFMKDVWKLVLDVKV